MCRRSRLHLCAALLTGVLFASISHSTIMGRRLPNLRPRLTHILRFGGYTRYQWVDDHQFLYVPYKTGQVQIWRRNTQTNRTERIIQKPESIYLNVAVFSPDGAKVLWPDFVPKRRSNNDDRAYVYATTLRQWSRDGVPSRRLQWRGRWADPLLWLHDSRHFAVWKGLRIVLHDIRRPRYTRTIRLVIPSQFQRKGKKYPLGAISQVQIARAGNKERFIFSNSFRGSGPVIAQFDFFYVDVPYSALRAPRRARLRVPVRHFAVRLPPFAHFLGYNGSDGFTISPNGKRVAWWLQFDDTPPTATTSAYKMARAMYQQLSPLTLWVCDVGGGNLHTLGNLPIVDENHRVLTRRILANIRNPLMMRIPNNLSQTLWEQGQSLQWLPDNKRLSFLYKKSLWTVRDQDGNKN